MSHTKRVTFPCNVSAGRDAAKEVSQFLAEQGLPEDIVFACELSLTEACNNAVQHASESQRRLELGAEATATDGVVHLSVSDHTNGFNYTPVPAPAADINAGRGLFLIQSMMDEVEYRQGNGENVLQMRKRISAA